VLLHTFQYEKVKKSSSNQSRPWEEFFHEYIRYTRSVELYYSIRFTLEREEFHEHYQLGGIEADVYKFDRTTKTGEIRTPDIYYKSTDNKSVIFLEIVVSFSENYGRKEIDDLYLYQNNFGIDLPFQNQYLIYFLPKKDYELFRRIKDDYLSDFPDKKPFFSKNFAVMLWEKNQADDFIYIELGENHLPQKIGQYFENIEPVSPEVYFTFTGPFLFLKQANITYTCLMLFYVLFTPGNFRKSFHQFSKFEFTLEGIKDVFERQIRGYYPKLDQIPVPNSKHLKDCLYVLLMAKQIEFKNKDNDGIIKQDTVLVSSVDMLNRALNKSVYRKSNALFYSKMAYRWKENEKKKKRMTKKQKTISSYFKK